MANVWLDQKHISQTTQLHTTDNAHKAAPKRNVLGDINNLINNKNISTLKPFAETATPQTFWQKLLRKHIIQKTFLNSDKQEPIEFPNSEATTYGNVPLLNYGNIHHPLDYLDMPVVCCYKSSKKIIAELWTDCRKLENTFINKIINDKPDAYYDELINPIYFIEDKYLKTDKMTTLGTNCMDIDFMKIVKLPVELPVAELTVNCNVLLVNNENIHALDYMDSQVIYCNDNCKKRITEIWSDYTKLDNTFLCNIINDKPESYNEEYVNTQIFLENDHFSNMEQFEMPSDTNYQKNNDYIEEVKLPDLMDLDFF